MNSKFKEFWSEFTRDVDFFNKYDKRTAKKAAKEAWNTNLGILSSSLEKKTNYAYNDAITEVENKINELVINE